MRRYLLIVLVSVALLSCLSVARAQELRTVPLPGTTSTPVTYLDRTGPQLYSTPQTFEAFDAQLRRDRREEVNRLYRSQDWYGPPPSAFLYGKCRSP
jgi:hypothetical protein